MHSKTKPQEAKTSAPRSENLNICASMNAEISSFEEKKIDKTTVVFYKMIIGFTKNNKKWFILKRYSDFDTLTKTLKDLYPNLPSLPSKTLFKLSDQRLIEERRKTLNAYIKELINRKDMRTCTTFRKFIDLDGHFPQSKIFEPKRIGTVKDFTKGVRDFLYLPQYNTGFIAQSDMNLVTRMDSYFTNVSVYPYYLFIHSILNVLVDDAMGKERQLW